MQTLVVTLRVAKRMKYDFTGEKIDTLDLLKIRVNDLDIKKKIFARYFIIYYFIKEQLFKVLLFAIVIILTFIYLKGKKLF